MSPKECPWCAEIIPFTAPPLPREVAQLRGNCPHCAGPILWGRRGGVGSRTGRGPRRWLKNHSTQALVGVIAMLRQCIEDLEQMHGMLNPPEPVIVPPAPDRK